MNARKNRTVRALLIAGLLLVPGMQGCSKDTMGILKQLHPYVGKLLDSAGKSDKPAKADKAEAPKAPKSEGSDKPADDGAKAKKEKDAKKVEQL